MDFLKQNKLVIGLIAFVVAGGAWFVLSGSSGPAGILSSTSSGGEIERTDSEMIALLLELRSISLDSPVLTDPSFQQLRDFSTAIVSEPVGRQNPFAPFSSVQTQSTTAEEEDAAE